MNRKNYKKHVAYELLVVLGMSAILLFVCRLWPLLILALLSMLGAATWLILANRNAEEPEKLCALLPSHEQNEALGRIQAIHTSERSKNNAKPILRRLQRQLRHV